MYLKLKYYMEEGDERVYTLQHFIDEEEDNIILFEMKRDIGGVMWCDVEKDFLSYGCYEGCGNYNPCNGKNGRCRNLKNGFVETGKKFILKDGLLTPMDKK